MVTCKGVTVADGQHISTIAICGGKIEFSTSKDFQKLEKRIIGNYLDLNFVSLLPDIS